MIYWLCQRQGSSCHPRVTDAFLVIKRIKEVIRSIFCCELKCVATDQLPRHNLWYYPSLYTIQINYSSSSYILHTWKLLMRTKYCFHSYHVRKSHTRSLIRLLVLPNQYLFIQDELIEYHSEVLSYESLSITIIIFELVLDFLQVFLPKSLQIDW